ncbi:hypothetical protein BG004_006005 [Podila humilis]|nr:hypothetical protein BG004_006005 [Podila humilis]
MGTQLYRSEGPACPMIVGGCPTAPGPGTLQTSAPFAELMVSVQIVGSNQQTIVCVAVLLEQTMAPVNTAIGLLPLAMAIYTGTISLTATLMRASVGNGFLGAVATYGLASEAISVHTPGLFDVIIYTQFMLMTGQLAINYPSFYSTFTALFHWSFLNFKDTLLGSGPTNATFVRTFGGAGSVNQIDGRGRSINGNSSTGANNNQNMVKRSSEQPPPHPFQLPAVAPYLYQVPLELPTGAHRRRLKPTVITRRQYVATLHFEVMRNDACGKLNEKTGIRDRSRNHSRNASNTSNLTTNLTPYFTPNFSISFAEPKSKPKPQQFVILFKVLKNNIKIINSIKTCNRHSADPSANINLAAFPVSNDRYPSIFHQHDSIRTAQLDAYAAAIGAYPSNLFLGTLINAALAMVASLVLSGLFLVLAWVMAKEKHQKGKTLQHATNFIHVSLTAMYQLTLSGGIAKTVAAALAILVVSVGATVYFTWRVLHASTKFLIFDDQATLLKYGVLYNTLTEEGTLFFLVTLLVRFLWGLVVSMLSSFGIAQVAVLMVVEFGYVLVIAVKWPFAESSDNKFHLFMAVIRLVITGCGLAYIHELQTSPEVRQLFGYIQMSLHLAIFIVIFALAIWNTIQVIMFWRTRHSDAWKGPIKTYDFVDPSRADDILGQNWSLPNGSDSDHLNMARNSNRDSTASDHDSMDQLKGNRRFTVQTFASLSNLRPGSVQYNAVAHQLAGVGHNESSDDETIRFGTPAERYRHSRLLDLRRPRFASESDADSAIVDRRFDPLLPVSNYSAAGTSSRGADTNGSDTLAPVERHNRPSSVSLSGATPSESAANQDESAAASSSKAKEDSTKRPSLWGAMKATLGSALTFGKRNGQSADGSPSKPKAFEVMRPPRPTFADQGDASSLGRNGSTGSQTGGEGQLRELNSLGISRFFQESDRGYEKNRNLFVANPEDKISRHGSIVSTLSSALPSFSKLYRNGSDTGASIRSQTQSGRHPERGSASGLSMMTTAPTATSLTALAAVGAGVGGPSVRARSSTLGTGDRASTLAAGVENASISEQGSTAENRRFSGVSTAGGSGSGSGLIYARGSAESNMAEALLADTAPLRLQGGGILKVSKGPEKAVRYWHRESGQYVESSAESLKSLSRLSTVPTVSTNTASAMSSTSPSPVMVGVVTATPEHIATRANAAGPSGVHNSNRDSILDSSRQSIASSRHVTSLSGKDGSVATPVVIIPMGGASLSSPTTASPQSPQSPESPGSVADSQQSGQSTNLMASAGRMHEILGRMFSVRQDMEESESMSEDTCSTFSGRASGVSTTGTRPGSGLQHHRTDALIDLSGSTQTMTADGSEQNDEPKSAEIYDMLEPVQEDSDDDHLISDSSLPLTDAMLSPDDSGHRSNASSSTLRPTVSFSQTSSGIGNTSSISDDVTSNSSGPAEHKERTLLSRTSSESSQPGVRGGEGGTSSPFRQLSQRKQHPPIATQLRSSGSNNSLTSRPLAQSVLLRAPSMTMMSTSHPNSAVDGEGLSRQPSLQSSQLDYLYFSDLNRNSSIGTVMTTRTEDSYVTAQSQQSDEMHDEEFPTKTTSLVLS